MAETTRKFTVTLIIVGALACGEARRDSTAPTAQVTRSDDAVAGTGHDAAPHVADAGSPADASAEVKPTRAGSPGEWGDYCASDGECTWDNRCDPHACVAASKASSSKCAEVPAPPGTCQCASGNCSLRPHATPALSPPGCKSDLECAVDPATATCHVVDNPGGHNLQGPLEEGEGPYCTCERAKGQCQFAWSEAVPCETFRECSFTRTPRLRPIPALEPRTRPLQPCVDGEIDSVCKAGNGGSKRCRIISWEC